VLTLERVDGTPIGDRDAIIAAGHDPDVIMKKCAEAFFYQVFRDGFFHADMHGGNAFVDRQGRIVPVDFGIMGRVDPDTRGYLAELLVAFLRRDYRAVAEVQFRAGYVPADQSLEMFAQACRSIGEPIFGKPSHQISIARLLAHLLRVTEQFEMTVQPQLLLLQKTMLMAEGMGTRLNPKLNIWELARPLIEDWMRTHFGPRATVGRAAADLAQGLRRLPRLIDSLHVVAEHERQKVERVETEVESMLTRWTRDIGFAEIIAVLALIAAIVAWWH
jgi:ubiquinone biosynthesis protein